MPRLLVIFLTSTTSLSFVSCTVDRGLDAESPRSASAPPAAETMDDEFEAPPPRNTVHEVMHAKLAHAQAILEAIALADFAQSEANARALKRISEGAEWLVQDTLTYFEYSAKFRNVCDDLIKHSRTQDRRALAVDYASLTNTCFDCHDYLRMERQTKDIPGQISIRGPHDSWLESLHSEQPLVSDTAKHTKGPQHESVSLEKARSNRVPSEQRLGATAR